VLAKKNDIVLALPHKYSKSILKRHINVPRSCLEKKEWKRAWWCLRSATDDAWYS